MSVDVSDQVYPVVIRRVGGGGPHTRCCSCTNIPLPIMAIGMGEVVLVLVIVTFTV